MAKTERETGSEPRAATAARATPAPDPLRWLDLMVFTLFFLMVL